MIVRKVTERLSEDFRKSCFVFDGKIYLEGFQNVVCAQNVEQYYKEVQTKVKGDEAFFYVYDAVRSLFYGNNKYEEHKKALGGK